MLTKVIPQLMNDGERSCYIQDPLRAAVIMLYVWRQYQLTLNKAELHQLCSALCLPKLDKGEFLNYWTDFSKDVTCLKRLIPKSFSNLVICHTV